MLLKLPLVNRSRLGGCLLLNRNSGAFLSFSKMDTTISHSSAESEIKALDELCRHVEAIREILSFLGILNLPATVLFVDNKASI